MRKNKLIIYGDINLKIPYKKEKTKPVSARIRRRTGKRAKERHGKRFRNKSFRICGERTLFCD